MTGLIGNVLGKLTNNLGSGGNTPSDSPRRAKASRARIPTKYPTVTSWPFKAMSTDAPYTDDVIMEDVDGSVIEDEKPLTKFKLYA